MQRLPQERVRVGDALTDPTPEDLSQMRNNCTVSALGTYGFIDSYGEKRVPAITSRAGACGERWLRST